jgi:1,4-alpha-glucan branching enzyme
MGDRGRAAQLQRHRQQPGHVSEPRVLQWVTDSLRWWVQAYGVDGFRFDLAVSLGRVRRRANLAFHPPRTAC